MATITATLGNKTAFAGGSDDLICYIAGANKSGVQISAQGFTLNNATVQAKGIGTSTLDTVTVSSAVATVIVGEGMIIDQVRISGVTGGSYFVTVSQ